MIFANACPFSLYEIDSETGVLIKVLLPNQQCNQFYYMQNREIALQLQACLFSRRDEFFFLLPLSAIPLDQLSHFFEPNKENLLTTEPARLENLTQAMPWQRHPFQKQRERERELERVRMQNQVQARSAQQSFTLASKILMATMVPFVMMNSVREEEMSREALYFILAMALFIGGTDFFVRSASRNRFGLFDVLHRPSVARLIMDVEPPLAAVIRHV